MLVHYFMQMIYDRLHGRIAWEPLPCRNLYPCTHAVRLDAYLLTYLQLLLLCIISVMWCLVEDCLWVVKALDADNVVTTGEIMACILGVWWGLSWSGRILWWVVGQVFLGGVTWASPIRGTYGGCMWDEEILGWSVLVGLLMVVNNHYKPSIKHA